MSDSLQPHRWQPTRLRCPWDSPGKNTGVGCHFLHQCMKVKSESHSVMSQLFTTPWTAAYQAPPSMGFSRQEYWSGVPSPSMQNNGNLVSQNELYCLLFHHNIKLPKKMIKFLCVSIHVCHNPECL